MIFFLPLRLKSSFPLDHLNSNFRIREKWSNVVIISLSSVAEFSYLYLDSPLSMSWVSC
jgi:hypothetical protein